MHTRKGTGKKRGLNGCTSVATATTAVHATSENVTDIQLCIAALAGFPSRTVVPIGGSARGYQPDFRSWSRRLWPDVPHGRPYVYASVRSG
jgi:hypothetical protein